MFRRMVNAAHLVSSPSMVAGRIFGTGSSRENAVWALLDMGIRSVFASLFGDIFYNNASKNGLLCVKLPDKTLNDIRFSINSGWATVSVDLGEQSVTYAGKTLRFEIEPQIKERLISGMDDIAITTANYLSRLRGKRSRWLPSRSAVP